MRAKQATISESYRRRKCRDSRSRLSQNENIQARYIDGEQSQVSWMPVPSEFLGNTDSLSSRGKLIQSMAQAVVGINDVIVGDNARNYSLFQTPSALLVKDLGGVQQELAELQDLNKAVFVSNEKLMKSNQEMLNLILVLIDSKPFTKTY